MLASVLVVAVAHAAPVAVRVDTAGAVDVLGQLDAGFIEGGRGPWRHFEVADADLAALDAAGLAWERLPLPPPDAADGYRSPAEMVTALQDLAAAHPSLAEVVVLGASVEERPIVGLRITAALEPAVGWRVLGAHHGDERSSAALALATAERLLAGYGDEPALTALLDRDEVWVVPIVNPDGVARDARNNANGVDLNRNYGFGWSASAYRSGDGPFSEPETRAVRTHAQYAALGAGLSMHSGETNLGWVWNYSSSPVDDTALLEDLARRYADACSVPGFWITNGADWYATQGDTNDWSYGQQGILDYTLEATLVKTPPASELPTVLGQHLPGVLAFLTWPTLITGRVVDATSGLGIPADVVLVEADHALATDPGGRFGRPVSAGRWTAQVRAPGYAPQLVDLTPGEPAFVSLVRAELVEARPAPALLSRTGAGRFELDVDTDEVVLERPGEDPIPATAEGGAWSIDPSALTPGPWTLRTDAGVAPRSLFIGEIDDAVVIHGAYQDGYSLVLEGAGFAAGTRAWALSGPAREPVPLRVDALSNDTVALDLEDGDALPDPLDVLVVSAGYQLAVLDVRGALAVDTAAPEDTGPGTRTDPEGPNATGTRGTIDIRACQTAPGVPLLGLVIPMLLVAFRRSR